MRWIGTITLLTLFATPAAAWQAGIDAGLCTLTHSEDGADVLLTYDPAGPEYSITMTRPTPWPDGAIFSIRFDGARSLTIRTDRHVLSEGGRALTVTDRGFGNVLDGLEFNSSATGFVGAEDMSVTLDGAADAVRAFRDCGRAPTA